MFDDLKSSGFRLYSTRRQHNFQGRSYMELSSTPNNENATADPSTRCAPVRDDTSVVSGALVEEMDFHSRSFDCVRCARRTDLRSRMTKRKDHVRQSAVLGLRSETWGTRLQVCGLAAQSAQG